MKPANTAGAPVKSIPIMQAQLTRSLRKWSGLPLVPLGSGPALCHVKWQLFWIRLSWLASACDADSRRTGASLTYLPRLQRGGLWCLSVRPCFWLTLIHAHPCFLPCLTFASHAPYRIKTWKHDTFFDTCLAFVGLSLAGLLALRVAGPLPR